MSYEPLHHKYRPKSFAQLVGQEAIATTLSNAISTSRIAPAYLFTGPRGTGKTSSARILAKSLNCLSSPQPTATPCGICDVCQGISKGYSIDVIEIDAASNTGVDNIREIIERAQFAPVQCRYKVYVIDECHMLSTQAFNALLKTLEEPPKHIVFVLATTDPQRVLPTIISRCQRFDFRRIPLDAMVSHLKDIAIKEGINITIEAITLVAQLSQGGLRDAESLLDQLSLLPNEVTPDKVWDLVGSVSEHDLYILLRAIASDNTETVIDSTRKILDRGREPLTILQNLAAFYRDLLIAKTAKNRGDLVACTQETWHSLVEFAQTLDIRTILAGQKHLRDAEVQIKNTTHPRLWLEVTILGLLPSAQQQFFSGINTLPSNNNPINTPHQQSNHQSPNHQPPNHQQPNHQPPNHQPPNHQQANYQEQDLTQVWQQVLAHLEPVSRRELLRQMCHVIEVNETTARLGIKQAWYKRAQGDLQAITEAFKAAYQRPIIVELEIANTAQPKQTSRDTRQNGSTRPVAPTNSTEVPSAPPVVVQPTTLPSLAPEAPPVTETLKPAEVSIEKSEPAANNNGSNGKRTDLNSQEPITPITPITPVTHVDAEKILYAAERLADFFDGQIVGMNENAAEVSDSAALTELIEIESDDD